MNNALVTLRSRIETPCWTQGNACNAYRTLRVIYEEVGALLKARVSSYRHPQSRASVTTLLRPRNTVQDELNPVTPHALPSVTVTRYQPLKGPKARSEE